MGEWLAARGVALQNLLTFGEPYRREAGLWEPDVRTPTRLGEPQITLRLARTEGGQVVPWFADTDPLRAWALSEVTVRAARISGPSPDPQLEPLIARTRRLWPSWDQEIPILVLRPGENAAWRGDALDRQQRRLEVGYDLLYGLAFLPASERG
jgi:CRISPR-associated endonuclease/helicase Cas3